MRVSGLRTRKSASGRTSSIGRRHHSRAIACTSTNSTAIGTTSRAASGGEITSASTSTRPYISPDAPSTPATNALRSPGHSRDMRLNPSVTAVEETRPPSNPLAPSPREPRSRKAT